MGKGSASPAQRRRMEKKIVSEKHHKSNQTTIGPIKRQQELTEAPNGDLGGSRDDDPVA